jgi:hypothetical protein
VDSNTHDVRVNGRLRTTSTATTPGDPVAEHESEFVKHDRSLIDRSSSSRVHWALGLLSVEEDIKKISLDDK